MISIGESFSGELVTNFPTTRDFNKGEVICSSIGIEWLMIYFIYYVLCLMYILFYFSFSALANYSTFCF